MSTLVILVGADSTSVRMVRAVLRDWSAVGLLRPFLWVDESDVRAAAAPTTAAADLIENGLARGLPVQDHLANQPNVATVRVGVVSLLGKEGRLFDVGLANTLRNALFQQLPGNLSAVHCVLTRHGSGGWDASCAWQSWHTMVAAPEDAFDPGAVADPVLVDDDAFVRHAAAAVAGLLGLWTGVGEGPLDRAATPDAERATVARCFLRRLDAGPVVESLRGSLTDVTSGMPEPMTPNGPLEAFEFPAEACRQVTAAVTDKHESLFARVRRAPEPAAVVEINWRVVLRMFFSFLAAALRNAPREWAETIVGGTASAAARILQDHVFGGSQSQYDVVVRGRTASGKIPGIAELTESAERLTGRLQDDRLAGEYRAPHVSPFWQDFVRAALTLADGREHTPGVQPPLVGERAGFVRNARHIAPRPEVSYELTPAVANLLGVERVNAHDARTANVVAQGLQQLAAQEGNRSGEVARELDRFSSWYRPLAQTYTGRVGQFLASFLATRQQDVAALLAQLRELANASAVPVDVAEGQRSLARRLLLLTALIVLGIVAVGVLLVLTIVSVVAALLIILGVLLVGFLLAIGAFYRQQRQLFAILNARRQQESQLVLLRENLRNASRELHLATIMWGQLLAWAPVVGRFLSEPFGRSASAAESPGIRLGGSLPRAMGIGVARSRPNVVERVAHRLRGQLFRPGWLGELWEVFLAAAPERLGRDGLSLEGRVNELYRDRAASEESLLRRWSADAVARGVDRSVGDQTWAHARRLLLSRGVEELARNLFSSVDVVGHEVYDMPPSQPGLQFLTGLLGGKTRNFQFDLFTATARSSEFFRVRENIVIASADAISDGATPDAGPSGWVDSLPALRRIDPAAGVDTDLNQFVLLVQTSGPVPARQLRLLPDREGDGQQPAPSDESLLSITWA